MTHCEPVFDPEFLRFGNGNSYDCIKITVLREIFDETGAMACDAFALIIGVYAQIMDEQGVFIAIKGLFIFIILASFIIRVRDKISRWLRIVVNDKTALWVFIYDPLKHIL